jgi:uncharacterized membrane protein YbhN (UPF0104 family)
VILASRRILQRWNGTDVHVQIPPFALSIVVLTIANFFQALGWKFLLERMSGRALPTRALLSVFMLGQLARYTPGKVGLPMVRIAGTTKLGLSARLVAASVGIEVAGWIGVGALIGCVSLLCNPTVTSPIPGLSRPWIWCGLLVTSSGLAAALLLDRNHFPLWVRRLLRAEGQGPFVSMSVVGMQLLAWSGWWVLGLLIPMSVGSSIEIALSQAAIFIVAPIVGFLALVAPGGLGVRETVISFALAPKIGASAAIAAAVLARASALASEIMGWLLAITWERRSSR